MRALRFENKTLALTDIPVPDFPDEALVRVRRAGICATDTAITQGYANFSGTLGHEFVGTVERAPDSAWIGRRVVGDINIGCGECRQCNLGDGRHCPLRRVLGIRNRDGAFAEYLSLPLRNLCIVPDHVPDAVAVFAEPTAAALQILDQTDLSGTSNILVLGDGKLGQLIARVLKANRLSPTLIGKYPSKLALAETAGIPTRLFEDVVEDSQVQGAAEVVVEATGRTEGIAAALRFVSPRGTVVLKSTLNGDVSMCPRNIVVPEVTLLGSRCGRIVKGMKLLAEGGITVEPLIEAEFPLSEAFEAFTAAQRPGSLKIQIVMDHA